MPEGIKSAREAVSALQVWPLSHEAVAAAVETLRCIAGDPEEAHSFEDEIHAMVLRAIAAGECEEPARCASAALRTAEILFPRWCA